MRLSSPHERKLVSAKIYNLVDPSIIVKWAYLGIIRAAATIANNHPFKHHMTTNLFSDTPSAGSMARQEDDEPNQRPLQLPKIGWGDDDEPDGNDNITPQQHPAFGQDESDGGVVLRALSRNSEGDLMPIPEDVVRHMMCSFKYMFVSSSSLIYSLCIMPYTVYTWRVARLLSRSFGVL